MLIKLDGNRIDPVIADILVIILGWDEIILEIK